MRITPVVLAACLVSLGAPAQAAVPHPTPAPVTLPARVPASARVTLLGADSGRFVLARNGGQVLSGTGTRSLADHGARYRDPADLTTALSDVTGTTLRFFEQRPGGTTWYLTTSDLLTGSSSTSTTTEQPIAFAPDGWIGRAQAAIVLHRSGHPDRTLVSDVAGDPAPVAAANATGIALAYPTETGGVPGQRTVLITGSGTEVLASSQNDGSAPARATTGIALTPHSVVWSTIVPATNGSPQIFRRARAGGPVSEADVPGGSGGPFQARFTGLAATDDQVAVLHTTLNRQVFSDLTTLRVLKAGDWREVALPDTYSAAHGVRGTDVGGIRADGSHFVLALGGDLTDSAGVYEIGTGDATRVATVPSAPDTISDVTLSAGRLGYGRRDAGAPADADVFLNDRTVATTAGGALQVGDEVPDTGFHLIHAYDGRAAAVSYSAGRSVVRSALDTLGKPQFVTFDGGAFTGGPYAGPRDTPFKVSGPYTLADGRIYRAGQPADVLDLSAATVSDVDIFGSRVIWRYTSGTVRMRDLASPAAPVTLATDGAGQVAVWGNTVAWATRGGTIAVRTVSSSKIRVVQSSGTVTDLALSESALTWADGGGQIWAVNTRSARSVKVDTGLHYPAQADDHLIAGLDASGRVRVQQLPFGAGTTFRPRLIGTLAPASFEPAAGAWKPEFDASKPLTGVKLRVRRANGALVRSLTGTGPHGSIRDLIWDGKATNGTLAPRGTYAWTLTATARDGDGTLTDPDGGNNISGTVTVS